MSIRYEGGKRVSKKTVRSRIKSGYYKRKHHKKKVAKLKAAGIKTVYEGRDITGTIDRRTRGQVVSDIRQQQKAQEKTPKNSMKINSMYKDNKVIEGSRGFRSTRTPFGAGAPANKGAPSAQGKAPTLTKAQIEGIRAGKIKAPAEMVKAVMEGRVNIKQEGLIGKAKKFLGIESLGAEHYAAAAGLSAVPTVVAAAKLVGGAITSLNTIGKAAVAKKITEVATNTKTVMQTEKILSKSFSKKALAVAGAWAGAVYLGKWAQAESTEPLGITMNKYLIPNALETGDWGLVEDAQNSRDEILNLDWWEKVGLWSPISPAIGIPNKIKGAIAAAKVQDKVIADLRQQQETGETDDQRWARVRQEQADQEKAAIDYYNSERRKLEVWILEAREAARAARRKEERRARNEDAAFWAAQKEKQRELEAADRQAIAKFWMEYRKAMQKLQEERRPSQLNFGGLF